MKKYVYKYIYIYTVILLCFSVLSCFQLIITFAFWLFAFASSSISILMYRLYMYLCHVKWYFHLGMAMSIYDVIFWGLFCAFLVLVLALCRVLSDTGRISWSSCPVKKETIEATCIHMLVMS